MNNIRNFNNGYLLIKNEKMEINKKINPNGSLNKKKSNKNVKRKAIDSTSHCLGYFTLCIAKKTPARITKSSHKELLLLNMTKDRGNEIIDSISQNFGAIRLFINKARTAKNKK